MGESGWWILYTYIPLVGIFCLIYMFFAPGEKGDYGYGPQEPNKVRDYLIIPGVVLLVIICNKISSYPERKLILSEIEVIEES